MLSKILDYWKQVGSVIVIVGIAVTFVRAEQTAKKAVALTEIAQQLTVITAELKTPSLWLRNFLINRGVDSVTAKAYSEIPRSSTVNDKGNPIPGLSFINPTKTPDVGELIKITIESDTVVVDTVWDVRRKE